jgi:folylpolyglutamate synthase/dihydropteroate synthase
MGRDRAFDLIKLLAPLAKELVYFTAELPRACDFEQMLALTPEPFHSKVRRGNWKDIDLELQEAEKNKEEDLLVTGSIYLVGQVLSVHENHFLPTSSSLQDYV